MSALASRMTEEMQKKDYISSRDYRLARAAPLSLIRQNHAPSIKSRFRESKTSEQSEGLGCTARQQTMGSACVEVHYNIGPDRTRFQIQIVDRNSALWPFEATNGVKLTSAVVVSPCVASKVFLSFLLACGARLGESRT